MKTTKKADEIYIPDVKKKLILLAYSDFSRICNLLLYCFQVPAQSDERLSVEEEVDNLFHTSVIIMSDDVMR